MRTFAQQDVPGSRWAAAAAAGLVFAVAAYQLTRPGYLFGPSADIGVYLGASVRLLSGALPYRDFVFVQPPGIVILAAPFAAASHLFGTRDGLAALRLAMVVADAWCAYLAARLVAHRGAAAALIAGTVAGLFPAVIYAIAGPILEPVINLLVLLAANLAFREGRLRQGGWLLGAGVLLGMTLTVKLSAVTAIFALLAVCLFCGRTRALALGWGIVIGAAVASLPFALPAPGAFWNDVVWSQLHRFGPAARVPLPARLAEATGAGNFGGGAAAAMVAMLAVGLCILAGAAVLWRRHRGDQLAWFAVAAVVLTGVAQALPAQYYPQYPALLAPFAAIILALACARLPYPAHGLRSLLAGAVIMAPALISAGSIAQREAVDPVRSIQAVVPAGACALSDSPKYLIASDRFLSTRPVCPPVTDLYGTMLALGPHAQWKALLGTASYLVSDTPFSSWYIHPDPGLQAWVLAHFRAVRIPGLIVYVRDT